MFIGEAPGATEDLLGVPFVGTAGRILNWIISDVPHQFSYLITNTVCCRPQTVVYLEHQLDLDHAEHNPDFSLNQLIEGEDYEIQEYNREPHKAEIEACRPHVDELLDDYKPHGIVYLGSVAKSHPVKGLPTVSLKHPAYIARLEFKLQTARKEAHKIELLIERIINENLVENR